MTVKELEEALGMTRANIRYYEREGLLAPSRTPNGYRAYTEEDADTLRKIKLLRQLQCSVEEIRAVQRGERELSGLLEEQAGVLARRSADLEAARTLCRELARETVDYQALDPRPYLEELDRLSRSGRVFPGVEADVLPSVHHPWLRWFARTLDFGLCRFAFLALLFLGFRVVPSNNLLVDLLLNYVTWGLVFLTEPLLLATWGTTPGKWLMGLSIRDEEGNKLTWKAAFQRTTDVFVQGCGCGIPFYEWYRNYKSYRTCEAQEVLPWDEGLAYNLRDQHPARVAGFFCGETALVVLVVLMGLSTLLPPVRGPLTVADYARNYNDLLRQYDQSTYYQLSETGTWEEQIPQGTYVVGAEAPPPLRFTLEDGAVTAVSVEYTQEPSLFGGGRASDLALVMALLGAQREVTALNLNAVVREMPEELGRDLETYSVTVSGVTVSNTVTYSGYEDVGGMVLFPNEGEAQSYHQVFTVSLTEW